MSTNVFVLGLDEHNRNELEALPDADAITFHPLLTVDDLTHGQIDLHHLLDAADKQLAAFDGTVDAIVGYWDFPVSSMVPILCHQRGLPCAELEAVLKCEHKYWSRLVQRQTIEEYPPFDLADLDSTHPPPSLRYPLWIKPVKSFSSDLAFRVRDDDEYRQALEEIREGVGRIGTPFDAALAFIDLPEEIAAAGGQACLAEEAVSGEQVTVEGYHDGSHLHVYGIIDAHTYDGSACFLRYQYPSTLPPHVIHRLEEITRRVITGINLYSVFNVEYFWDQEHDTITLLEINPRQSQSHSTLFDYVDGAPNHQYMLRLALGQTPNLPNRQGRFDTAAKWFYRRFSDGFLRRGPTRDEVTALQREIPGVEIVIEAQQGHRLSELPQQDSYSYNLASLHIGARDEDELTAKYHRCTQALRFDFDD